MTERPITKLELLLLALGAGLLCGLALFSSPRASTEQAEDRGHSNREEFLTTTPELRAPLSQKWYGLPRYNDAAFPEGEAQEQRLY